MIDLRHELAVTGIFLARRLAVRYATEQDMHAGYRAAPVETLRFALAPAA